MTNRVSVMPALLLTSGCATTTGGTATPAAQPPPATPESLPSLLLPAGEVGAALSGTDMVVTRDVSTPWNDSAHVPEGVGCLAVAGAAQQGVYADTGWTAVHGQVLREPPTARWGHFATQAVVLFPDPGTAQAFFARSKDGWAGCANRDMTYAQQLAPEQVWAIGPAKLDGDVLALSREQRSPERWACQRALTVRGNTAVDVEACSLDGPTTAAAAIARSIAGRLPSA
ncbi:MAG: sensor domain-containing protein [Mycobacterium sp.]